MIIEVPDDSAVIILDADGKVRAALPQDPPAVPDGATPLNVVHTIMVVVLLSSPKWAEAREELVQRCFEEQRTLQKVPS